jgi:hypothetical protein
VESQVGRGRAHRNLGGFVDVDVTEAVRATVTMLKTSLDAGCLKVVGAIYALKSSLVRFSRDLDAPASQDTTGQVDHPGLVGHSLE